MTKIKSRWRKLLHQPNPSMPNSKLSEFIFNQHFKFKHSTIRIGLWNITVHVYRVILAWWKFWLYWRMTKIRQIKKRQFSQLKNLPMSAIELHYRTMPSYSSFPLIFKYPLSDMYFKIHSMTMYKGMLLFTFPNMLIITCIHKYPSTWHYTFQGDQGNDLFD